MICTSGMHLEGIKSNHSSCIGNPTTNSAQNASCLGKAAKYCSDKGYKGGFFTEIGDEIHVSCFKRSVAQPEFVDVADLKTYHDRCSDISDLNCFAAVNRYCNDIHGKSGIPQIAASSSRFKILCLSNARGTGVEP